MLFKCVKGMFQLQRNYKDAFNLDAFVDKYIEECMDKYPYVVGDISSSILRLKGFDNDPKSDNYFGKIDDYLSVSCALGSPFYVLKRIKSNEEYAHLEKHGKPIPKEEIINVTPITKENFDKESLILDTTPKGKANIIIDAQKINSIPKGKLASDLVEVIKQDKAQNNNSNNKEQQVVEEKPQTTYVSASPDFDPSKSQSARFNRNRNNNNNKSNNNNKNKNNNNAKGNGSNKNNKNFKQKNKNEQK